MGADLLSVEIAAPTMSDGSLATDVDRVVTVLRARLEALDGTSLDALAASLGLEDEDVEGTSLLAVITERVVAECTELMAQRRDLEVFRKDNQWWWRSGGMSYGDSPTDAFDYLCHLSWVGAFTTPVDGGRLDDAPALMLARQVADTTCDTLLVALARTHPELLEVVGALRAEVVAAVGAQVGPSLRADLSALSDTLEG